MKSAQPCQTRYLEGTKFCSMVFAGRKTRYTYVAMDERVDGVVNARGLAKIDLAASSAQAAVAAKIGFGPGRIGGEAVFVPSSPDTSALKGAENCTFLWTPDVGI